MSAPIPAQITISGALDDAAVAALVKVAMAAGAALLVQPRAGVSAPRQQLTGEVVEDAPRAAPRVPPPAAQRPPARMTRSAPVPRHTPGASFAPEVLERVTRALKNGPLRVAEFLVKARIDKYSARHMSLAGLIIASGATHSRRYALPATPAKEAP